MLRLGAGASSVANQDLTETNGYKIEDKIYPDNHDTSILILFTPYKCYLRTMRDDRDTADVDGKDTTQEAQEIPATTFLHFTKLPQELQDMIWQESVSRRLLRIQTNQEYMYTQQIQSIILYSAIVAFDQIPLLKVPDAREYVKSRYRSWMTLKHKTRDLKQRGRHMSISPTMDIKELADISTKTGPWWELFNVNLDVLWMALGIRFDPRFSILEQSLEKMLQWTDWGFASRLKLLVLDCISFPFTRGLREGVHDALLLLGSLEGLYLRKTVHCNRGPWRSIWDSAPYCRSNAEIDIRLAEDLHQFAEQNQQWKPPRVVMASAMDLAANWKAEKPLDAGLNTVFFVPGRRSAVGHYCRICELEYPREWYSSVWDVADYPDYFQKYPEEEGFHEHLLKHFGLRKDPSLSTWDLRGPRSERIGRRADIVST